MLRYLSLVTFAIIIYTIGLSLAETPMYYENLHNDENYELNLWIRTPDIKWLQGACTILLSYVGHPIFFSVKKELVLSDSRRSRKVIMIAIGFVTIFNMLIITAGYLSLGEKMQSNLYVLRRTLSDSDSDIPMKISLEEKLERSVNKLTLHSLTKKPKLIPQKNNRKK